MRKGTKLAIGACISGASVILAQGANLFGGVVSITTAAQTLTALLSLSTYKNAKQLTLKIDSGSSETIYCGGSTVTTTGANARIVLSAATDRAYTWQPGEGSVNTSGIYCVGSAAVTGYVDGVE